MNLTSTQRVSVTPDECLLYAPMMVVPLTGPLEPGCVRVSLIWGKQPADLDLYSYRVHQYRSEEQCLTYYCDGKDPCDGIDFDIDNKEGGEAGSETITYCNVEEYSHMVWVDDRSGLGSSLLDSQARLLITSDSGKTKEIALRPSEGQEGVSRYWLAGCLTTSFDWETFDTTFNFLKLNQFASGSPNLEQPLHCHTRTSLDQDQDQTHAEVVVSVADTVGRPLNGTLISLKTTLETYSKVVGSSGSIQLTVTEDGPYSLLAELDGYVPERLNLSLYCDGVEGATRACATRVQLTLLHQEEEGAMRIKLNWAGDKHRDLDLHLVSVSQSPPRLACHSYWNNMDGCKDTVLDHNMGANIGEMTEDLGNSLTNSTQDSGVTSLAETIRIHDFAAKPSLTFMVFVDDNTATGANLSVVQPQLTMTEGNTVVTAQMPYMYEADDGTRFWFAGCLEAVGTGFRYVAANTWSVESPNTKAAVMCDNVLGRSPQAEVPSFCEGTNLHLRVRDTQTDLGISNVTATVLRLEAGEQQMIFEGVVLDSQGELIGITQGGHYVVKVEADGYITGRQEVDIDCSLSDCGSCAPSILVPLSPSLVNNQLRLVLGGLQHLENLDMYSIYNNGTVSCATYPGMPDMPESTCPGIHKMTGDTGVETITYSAPSSNSTAAVYTIYVKWTMPVGEKEATFPQSEAWVSLTNGEVTEEVYMDAREYGAERHWVAGCLMVGGDTKGGHLFKSLNVFFTEMPDVEVPDLCLETFGLKHKGLVWSGQCVEDSKDRLLPYYAGSTRDNSPCKCKDKCYDKGYAYSGVEYGMECYCGNVPPPTDSLRESEECNMACSGDSGQICGAGWRMNVYKTGFVACECSYNSPWFLQKGCKISLPPPQGYRCQCIYEGWWGSGCSALARKCEEDEDCPEDCDTKTCCVNGGGNCGGY